jgi:hypothetical protein
MANGASIRSTKSSRSPSLRKPRALKGKGINVRGSGGYIIAPGARRSDNSAWIEKDDAPSFMESFRAGTIPPLPDWLLNIMQSRSQGIDPAHEPETQSDAALPSVSVRERAYAQAALAGCVRELEACAEGGRNNKLNAVAFRMGTMAVRGWIDRATVEAALCSACETNGLLHEGPHDVETAPSVPSYPPSRRS